MKFDYSGLEGLLNIKTYADGRKVLKYSREVFFKNLWNTDKRLLECRGLVLDANDEIIAYPFTKTFNLGENNTHITLNTRVIAPVKMNGFLATATITGAGELLVSTTGSLDSQFVQYAKDLLPQDLHKKLPFRYSCMFEICHPNDPHIVDEQPGAYLIGARSLDSLHMMTEESLDYLAVSMGVKRPYVVHGTMDQILELNEFAKFEGFMIRANDVHQTYLAKIKSHFYLSKKALQRLGIQKADAMWNDPIGFKKKLDEEFYAVFEHIINNYSKFNWLTLSEQERSNVINHRLSLQ